MCGLILILGLLNLFDLRMTIKAVELGVMIEANPIADFVIRQHGVLGVSVFKFLSIGTALVLLNLCRRSLLAELGCLLGVALYGAVGVAWTYYPMDELTRF